MPWGEVKVEDQRKDLIELWLSNHCSVSELCRLFEISRKTAYKWINRFLIKGKEGLLDLSRAPIKHGRRINESLEDKIIQLRIMHPTWGPKKLKAFLEARGIEGFLPAASTIGNILTRNGLVVPRRKRFKTGPRTQPLAHADTSNSVWCIDFKGWWMSGDNKKIEPFTVSDAATRYLFYCKPIAANNTKHSWGVLSTLFREYGLPLHIRSDNGPPFASRGSGGLSRLAVKLLKAGVLPERIRPGRPQENGRLERLHLTMKQDISHCLSKSYIQQLDALESWQECYNNERPHEALGQKTPSVLYRKSSRTWQGRLRSPEYPSHWKVLRVQDGGSCSWKGRNTYIGRVLEREPIGVLNVGNDLDAICYGPLLLGFMDREGTLKRTDKRLLKRAGQNLEDEINCYLCKWIEV